MKQNTKVFRTAVARRCFSSRVIRLWSILSGDEKEHFNLKSSADKKRMMTIAKEMTKEKKEWIRWGGDDDPRETGLSNVYRNAE